jgi:uncharacterized protein with PIN domain
MTYERYTRCPRCTQYPMVVVRHEPDTERGGYQVLVTCIDKRCGHEHWIRSHMNPDDAPIVDGA